MKYTIEYLVNGEREWQKFELTPRPEWVARYDFEEETEAQIDDWEAARLVETDENGVERKLAEWAPEVLTPKASDLGDSFEAQLAEDLGLSEEQRERLGHWLNARKEKG